jgi:hypothetical protein
MTHRLIRLGDDVPSEAILTDVEKSGNPTAISAELINISRTIVGHPIGKPRASSLYASCMRLRVLGTIFKKELTERGSVQARMTFGLGNAWHWWIQNKPDVFGERRVGWWKCYACNRVRYFGKPPVKNCEFCNAGPAATFYLEHGIDIDEPYPFTGHPDLFIEARPGVFRVTEIKSLAAEEYSKKFSPQVDHDWQLQAYMWALPYDRTLPIKIDPNVGYLCYLSKGVQTDALPIKTFVVKRNNHLIARIQEKLKTYKIGIMNYPKDVPQVFDICRNNNFNNYQAKYCPTKKECMELLNG